MIWDRVQGHDRVIELDGQDTKELCQLHGLLIALGWIETRVYPDAFSTPGKLVQCYRITRDGVGALNQYDRNMGLEAATVVQGEWDDEEETTD